MDNTLTTDLVTRSLNGEDVTERARAHDEFFLKAYQFTLHWYLDNYQFFGDPQVSIVKVGCNNLEYWSTTASLFCHDKIADVEFRDSVMPEIERVWDIGRRLEQVLRGWYAATPHDYERAHVHTNWLPSVGLRHVRLGIPMDDDTLREKFTTDRKTLEALAVAVFCMAAEEAPGVELDSGARINPYAISLDPARWDESGLFDDDGLTREEAEQMAFGIRNYFLDRPPAEGLGNQRPDLKAIYAASAAAASSA